jgi:molybdopterin synthase catalytic subunit
MISSALTREPIDVTRLISIAASNDAGALSLFVGTVRDINGGRRVLRIEYTAYEAMAETELARIVSEAAGRFDITALAVEHRIGTLELGDASVAIISAAPHRRAAIACTGHVIDEIKKRVPIWKREHYADGTREWVDPTKVAANVAV